MPVFLSLVFCWGMAASQCRTIVPDEPAAAGLAYCAARGQQLAAVWLADHPKWWLDRVRCSVGSKPQRQDDI
jgi:hypothetical protein